MKTKLQQLRAERENGDHGFTLIELLVVVVIIGILVAIAIPLYLNFRQGAENRSAQSDTRNAVSAIEQCFNDNGQVYPATQAAVAGGSALSLTCGTGANQSIQKVNVSSGNTLTYTNVPASGTTPAGYTVATKNTDTNKTYTYTSTTGQTVTS